MPRVTFRETSGRNRLQIGLESPSRTLCRAPLVIEEPGCSVFGHLGLCLMLYPRRLTRFCCWSLALSAVFSAGGNERFARLASLRSVSKRILRHSSSVYCSEVPLVLSSRPMTPSTFEGHLSSFASSLRLASLPLSVERYSDSRLHWSVGMSPTKPRAFPSSSALHVHPYDSQDPTCTDNGNLTMLCCHDAKQTLT